MRQLLRDTAIISYRVFPKDGLCFVPPLQADSFSEKAAGLFLHTEDSSPWFFSFYSVPFPKSGTIQLWRTGSFNRFAASMTRMPSCRHPGRPVRAITGCGITTVLFCTGQPVRRVHFKQRFFINEGHCNIGRASIFGWNMVLSLGMGKRNRIIFSGDRMGTGTKEWWMR